MITRKIARTVMKQDLGLSYRSIKRIAFRANSPRCLILRKECAENFSDELYKGKIYINVDETWINIKNYSRKCWRERGVVNSSNTKVIEPRISFFAAISTEGDSYFALT